MSNQEPRDLVSNLAETLGAEHEELNQAKTAEVIAHLERVIANVPPATEFTNTRKYVVLGPLLSKMCIRDRRLDLARPPRSRA